MLKALNQFYLFCLSRPFGVFTIVGLVCYLNALDAPFIFDDVEGIVANPGIRQLWPPQDVMNVGPDETPWGRPVVAYSLALNFAISGLEVGSYHLLNVLIHVAAATAFYFLMWQVILGSPRLEGVRPAGRSLAFGAALIWLVHPLATNVVTYTVQRAESLMALFYLLTLLFVVLRIRHEEKGGGAFSVLAVVACALGMASKETMVTAPLAALLLDYSLMGNGWKRIWRERWKLYLGLMATWGVLAALMLAWPRSQTVGAGDLSGFDYFLIQWQVVVHYLKLVVWPVGLSLDYGWPQVGLMEALPFGLGLSVLFVAGLWDTFFRKQGWGWCLIFMFLVLGPTSSVVPIQTSVVAEHRMVLPAAALIACLVVAQYGLITRLWKNGSRARVAFQWTLASGVVVALGGLTIVRNQDYETAVTIWQDVVEKQPLSDRGWNNLGGVLFLEGRKVEAEPCFRKALDLNPDYAEAMANLGVILGQRGELPESVRLLERAIVLRPDYLQAYVNLGLMTYEMGNRERAMESYRTALKLAPFHAQSNFNLAYILAELGRYEAALPFVETVLEVQPSYPGAGELLSALRTKLAPQ